jgi:sodium transport system permease protein
MGKQSTMLFRLDLTGILAILAMVLPLVAMFSGILFAVSTWARNMREAQTYLTSVSFVVLIPAVFSNLIGFTGVDKAIWLKFVPILSTGVGLRGAFLGTPDWTLILASGAIHLALGAICYVMIYRMMLRDRVLARI